MVDASNPLHMIASSNDYGSCCDQYYTSFNGGRDLVDGKHVDRERQPHRQRPGDVDRRQAPRRAPLLAELTASTKAGETCDGDVVVSPSYDGGLTWDKPVIVGPGRGLRPRPVPELRRQGVDHYRQQPRLPLLRPEAMSPGPRSSQTTASSSSRRSSRATATTVASTGRSRRRSRARARALCTFQTEGAAGECDEDQASVSTIGPGRHGLRRLHEQPELGALGAGRRVRGPVPRSSARATVASTGRSPRFVVGMEDGSRDYPINVDGRQTLTAYQVRVWGAGNIVADPTSNGHAVPGLLGQPQRRSRFRQSGHQLGRLRRQLDELRPDLDRADARRHGRRRPVVPVGRTSTR